METQTVTLTEFLLARIAEDEGLLAVQEFDDCDNPAHWRNKRLLAECEARRRIVEVAQAQVAGIEEGRPHRSFLSGRVHDGVAILNALALPYANHPDFRPEWHS